MRNLHLFSISTTLSVATLTGFLYWPFLSNGLIFDDHGLFLNGAVYDFAQVIFDLRPRTFPYFTLGFVKVLNSGLEANRIFSLAIHILCTWLLYLLLFALLKQTLYFSSKSDELQQTDTHIIVVPFFCVTWFAIHPIAVYGAGYLAQRTILFATLFSLLSVWFFCRAFAKNRAIDIVTAALFYSIAVFSKEHAIMLPLAVAPLTALYEGSFRSHLKRIALYFVLCLPAALTILLATKHIVATSYEPDVGAMIPQMHSIGLLAQPWGKWLVSIVLQAGFFFDYLAFWIVPDVRFLSADMRFDFVQIWSSWWVFPRAFFFFLSPLIALYFLRKKGLVALFCCGFLYSWFLFLTELAAIRFQEPFVLYRSYLWAPGYMMMLVAVCAPIPRRWLVMAAIPLFAILFLLARDRLSSLSTEENVWKDAAAKLESPTLVGSDRIFYNRGRAYLREKEYEEAIADFSSTIQQNSKVTQAYYNRALAFYALKKYTEAMTDLDHALLLNDKDSSVQYMRGLIFERYGCIHAAQQSYAVSMTLGNQIAKLKLDDMEKKNTAPKQRKQASGTGICPD